MKSLRLTAVLAAAGALTLIAAAPASAAGNAIDPGDSLYALWCDNEDPSFQLYGVDSPTGALTTIGSGSTVDGAGCSYQAAYNPATGVSYYLQVGMGFSLLATIDVATGASTTIGEFVWVSGEFPLDIFVEAIAIGGDGAAYALSDGMLYSVDLANARLTPISETIDDVYAFAWDSVTDGFYGVDASSNEVVQIDVEDGSFSLVGALGFPNTDVNDYSTYSLQFDAAGTLWLEVDYDTPDFYEASLWSASFATLGAPVYSGLLTLGGEPRYTESLLIIPGEPAPALAATGTEAMPALAGGVALLALGGLVLVARRRAA